jgi:hypothetical protein
MKKLLLTTIAALFLATGAAHAGEPPLCNADSVISTLSRITGKTVDYYYEYGYITDLGSNATKRFCSSNFLGGMFARRRPFVVEWIDETKGTFWVQIQ